MRIIAIVLLLAGCATDRQMTDREGAAIAIVLQQKGI